MANSFADSSASTRSTADIVKVHVTAKDRTSGETVSVPGASVNLYVKGKRIRTTYSDENGDAEISLAGLSLVERRNATISADKVVSRGTAIDGGDRDKLFRNFPKDGDGDYYRYTLELHSETLDSNGNWCGAAIPTSYETNKVDMAVVIDATGSMENEINSVASYLADIDYTTLCWFRYADGDWTRLDTDYSEEETMNIGARADLAGEGLCTHCKESAGWRGRGSSELVLPSVHTGRWGGNPLLYRPQYRQQILSRLLQRGTFYRQNADGITVKSFYAGSTDQRLNLISRDRTVYAAVEIVLEDGTRSALSEAIPLVAGEAAFSPGMAATRSMIVTILYRLDGSPAVSGSGNFTDVEAGPWSEDAVAWAVSHPIVSGYGNGLFGPNDNITREQLVTLLFRYAQYKGYDTPSNGDLGMFADGEEASGWAEEALLWAVGRGILTGKGNGILDPTGTATRAEVAQMLMKDLLGNPVPVF